MSEAADPELGVKVALASAHGARPDMVLARPRLTARRRRAASDLARADPSVRLSAAHTLSDRVGLGWNAGWEAASFRDVNGTTHTPDAIRLHGVPRLSISPRGGVRTPSSSGTFRRATRRRPRTHSTAGSRFVTPGVQLDLSAGVGLNARALDRFCRSRNQLSCAALNREVRLDRMPTSTVEDYWKQILLEEQGRGVSWLPTGRLAVAMRGDPGTVTAMVKAISESGLADYEAYGAFV